MPNAPLRVIKESHPYLIQLSFFVRCMFDNSQELPGEKIPQYCITVPRATVPWLRYTAKPVPILDTDIVALKQ